MPGNLQPRPTPIVDRLEDLNALRTALRGPARLVTVCGPPGVGKTRLAIEAALAEEMGSLEGGIWLCDLNGAAEPSTLCARVAATLELGPISGLPRGEVTRLGFVLAERAPLLLLLDGFDLLVDSGAEVIASWLRAAPLARFLVTSRERLRVSEELLVELDPLSAAAAIELFDARASAIARDWSAARHRDVVAEIVERLDRLPLAVELAAARMDLMGPLDLLAALDDRFDALAVSPRDSDAHHASLGVAIHASWLGLSERERAVLARASAFRGSFTLAAAREVLDADELPPLVDVLHSLRRKSLLFSTASGAQPGRARFRLYETVRQYAERQLGERGDAQSTRQRHAAYFTRADVEWVEDDLGDIMAVASESLGRDPALALRALLAGEPLLWRSGRAALIASLLSGVLETAAADTLPAKQRARALELRGRARRVAGDIGGAARDLDEALETWTGVGDDHGRARLLHELGTLELIKGSFAEARRRYDAAVEAHRIAGDRLGEASALDAIGAVVYQSGEAIDQARVFPQQALRLVREAGARDKEAIVRGHLGLFALERGMHHEATSQLEAALAIHRELGHVRFEAAELNNLGLVALDQEDLVAAADKLEAAVALQRRAGDARATGLALLDLGVCREESGDLAGGAVAYAEAAEIGRLIEDRRTTALALAYQGRVAARDGRPTAARAAFDEAETLLAGRGNPEVEAILAICRSHLEDNDLVLADDLVRTVAVRVALRMARHARSSGTERVVVTRSERAFAVGSDQPVSLLGRPTLWRVLLCLAEGRSSSPGVPVSRDAVFAAGWPDEHISSRSAAGRVRTAVYTLRKLGLSDVLTSSNEGYTFNPDVDLVLK